MAIISIFAGLLDVSSSNIFLLEEELKYLEQVNLNSVEINNKIDFSKLEMKNEIWKLILNINDRIKFYGKEWAKRLKVRSLNNIEFEIKLIKSFESIKKLPKNIQERIETYFKDKDLIYFLKGFETDATNPKQKYQDFRNYLDNFGFKWNKPNQKQFETYSENLKDTVKQYNFKDLKEILSEYQFETSTKYSEFCDYLYDLNLEWMTGVISEKDFD